MHNSSFRQNPMPQIRNPRHLNNYSDPFVANDVDDLHVGNWIWSSDGRVKKKSKVGGIVANRRERAMEAIHSSILPPFLQILLCLWEAQIRPQSTWGHELKRGYNKHVALLSGFPLKLLVGCFIFGKNLVHPAGPLAVHIQTGYYFNSWYSPLWP